MRQRKSKRASKPNSPDLPFKKNWKKGQMQQSCNTFNKQRINSHASELFKIYVKAQGNTLDLHKPVC